MPLPLARLIASSIALIAFAVALVAGLRAGNPADSILLRAMVAMMVCFGAGYGVGLVVEHIVRVHMRKIDAATDDEIARLEYPDEAEEAVTGETRDASTISRERAVV